MLTFVYAHFTALSAANAQTHASQKHVRPSSWIQPEISEENVSIKKIKRHGGANA